MRKTKYVWAVIVALFICIGVPTQATSYQYFPDVPDNAKYAYEINLLKEAGIFNGDENGNFNPDRTMTRAEAATIMARLFVGDVEPTSGAGSFTDVASTHWAHDYIETAVKHGMISGYGNGKFGPSDELTYNQAVTLLVRAIGYEESAQKLGGWPSGYISIGGELGITDDTINYSGNSVPRSTVAKLIFNACHKNSGSNDWDITGKWEYRYTYTIEGEPRTIIEFDLEIKSFDGEKIEGSYVYKVQDKPLMRSWRYSVDEENDYFYVESEYEYIGNLLASNYGQVYDYYVELYDSTFETSNTQPCFIIDRDEGILILTGHEQWNPLRPVKRAASTSPPIPDSAPVPDPAPTPVPAPVSKERTEYSYYSDGSVAYERTYDADDNLIKLTSYWSPPYSHILSYQLEYDTAGNIIQRTECTMTTNNNSSVLLEYTMKVYDGDGNLISQTIYNADGSIQ